MNNDEEQVDAGWLALRDATLSGWYNKISGELMTGFPVDPGDIVLDVGCGDGASTGFCADRGAHIILTDIDPAKVTQLAQRLAASPARAVESFVSDANPLPLEAEIANKIICTEVLEHVDDPKVVMAELVRVGKPGALYLLTVPDPAAEKLQLDLAPPQYFAKPNHIRIFERDEFQRLVEDAGLVIERRTSYGFYWALWWLLFWQTDSSIADAAKSKSLDAWTRTWSATLDGKDGLRIKRALDDLMPKSQAIVARKP